MRLIIPTIGTHLRLTKDWTFKLYRERRNNGLRKHLGMAQAGWQQTELSDEITLPKGTILIVNRVYLRQQAEAFDSITFRIHSSPHPKLKSGRFWAKLPDVNMIQCDLDPSTTPGMTGKSIIPKTGKQPKPRFGVTSGYKAGDRVVVRGYVKAGVGVVLVRRTQSHGPPDYEVALPLFNGKVTGVQRYDYQTREYLPGLYYGCISRHTDMRLATPEEITEQETLLAKGRKRRVNMAAKVLEALVEARTGNALTPNEHEIVAQRDGNPRSSLSGLHPWQRFIDLERSAYGNAAKTAAIELAFSASKRTSWTPPGYPGRDITKTEHKVMAAVQQGYLDADDVKPHLRLTTLEAVGDLLKPLWQDGRPLDVTEETAA